MENKLEYSFDDEFVSKFCYDIDNKKIEIHFIACYDLQKNERIKKPCSWIIENWSEAQSKIDGGTKFQELDKHIGIFSMILSAELKGDNLELYVNTIDNRYMTLLFINPYMNFEIL